MKNLSTLLLVICTVNCFAQVTITAATGGSNLTATPATLGNIVILESGTNNDIAQCNCSGQTIILGVPSGYAFTAGIGSVAFVAGKDITDASISVTSITITVMLTTNGGGTIAGDQITISDIQVYATAITGSSNPGNILRRSGNPGTQTVTGVTNDVTNFGALTTLVQSLWSQTSDPSAGSDQAKAITADASGIYVAGWDKNAGGGSEWQWRIEKRDLTTGTLIPAFGTAGVVTNNPSAGTDNAYAITADASGIYVAGYDNSPGGLFNYQWRIEKRDLTTGALVPAFGTAGVVTNNPGGNGEYPSAITADASGIYVAGNDVVPGNYQWRIEKRDLTTGALVAAFGGGVVTNNPSAGTDVANAIASDASGIYVTGYDNIPGDDQWRIEKRDLTTGALVAAFGTSGVVTNNPSAGSDRINAIASDASGIYVAGYDATGGNQWRIEKRDLTTGALDASFGTAGVITFNPTGMGSDVANAITADACGVYVAGFDATGTWQWRIEKYNLCEVLLPMEFLSLRGYNEKDINVLEWQTAGENNNDYFLLESSTDGTAFSEIVKVNGQGTGQQSYSYIDKNPSSGVLFYRLLLVNQDETFYYSNIVEVTFPVPETFDLINVFPNPAKDFFTIDFQLNEESGVIPSVRIYDSAGRKKMELTFKNYYPGYYSKQVEIAHLKTGVYILKLRAGKDEKTALLTVTK